MSASKGVRHNPRAARRVSIASRMERIVLACDNSLDCESIGHWLRHRGGYVNVRAFSDWDCLLNGGLSTPVDLLIADASMPKFDVASAIAVARNCQARHLLALDDRPREGRLAAVLNLPSVSYVSRKAGAAELLLTLEDILNYGRRVFDPAVAGRIRRTSRGLQLQPSKRGTSVAQLSKREREVMLMLAKGATVRETADLLRLSASTIDNHRSRIMKKLDVHKATELTCRAISDGLMKV